jgi:low affinity Fe/Cu permease
MSKQKSHKESRKGLFYKLAHKTSEAVGSPLASVLALSIVIIWGITGPIFKFSDTWQLVINTGTTIVTFLMVFLIQNSQNRDSKAVQIKLDELIRAIGSARNEIIDVEDASEQELKKLQQNFSRSDDDPKE